MPRMDSFSSFEKQLSALDEMMKPLVQIEFDDDFFHNILEEISIPKIPKKFSKEVSISVSILTIQLLRELSSKMWKRSNLPKKDKNFLDKLTLFLKQFQFAKSLKRYFDEKIYCPTYLHYYDPLVFTSVVTNNLNSDCQDIFFLTEIDINSINQDDFKKQLEQAENEMFLLNERWNKVLDENNADISQLEKETKIKMQPYHPGLSLYQYIFSDLNIKAKISLELIRTWILCYRKISNTSGKSIDVNQYSGNILKQIINFKNNIQNQQDDIKRLEYLIRSMKLEYNSLKAQEHLILNAINKKADLTKLRDSLNSQYEKHLADRSKLLRDLDSSVYGTSKDDSIRKEIGIIEDLIVTQFRDLKTLNYSVYLAEENSMELSTTLKDYMRWIDSNKEMLNIKQKELEKKSIQKKADEFILQRCYENLTRMKYAVGIDIEDRLRSSDVTPNNDRRIVSSNIQSLDESNCRFKDVNEMENDSNSF